MVQRLPARHSSKSNFSVVRKKTSSSYRNASFGSSSSRATARSGSSNRSTSRSTKSTKVNHFARLMIGSATVGIILAAAGYLGFQAMVQQALETGTQTVLFVPKTVADAPGEVWVLNLDRDIADSEVVAISSNTEVDLPGGYGKYRLAAVYPLLQLEQKDAQYTRASYSQSLGVLADAVVPLNSFDRKSGELKGLVLKSVWNWIWNRDKESLIILKTWIFLKRNPMPIQVGSLENLQNQVAEFEASRQVVQECPVGILNGSETAGAAGAVSKLLESGKIITIRVGTFPQDVAVSEIYHDGRAECLPVLKRVSSVMLQKPLVKLDKQMTTQYRSAIVIVLGKDLK